MKKGNVAWFIAFVIGTIAIWYTQSTVSSDSAMIAACVIQAGWLFACFHGASTLPIFGKFIVQTIKIGKSDDNDKPV